MQRAESRRVWPGSEVLRIFGAARVNTNRGGPSRSGDHDAASTRSPETREHEDIRDAPIVPGMKPRISVLTLGVDDLNRALQFYRDGLGFATEGVVGQEFEHGAVAFFDLQPGLRLAIWPLESIAHDSGLPATAPSPTAFTIGHNVSSEAEVDTVMAQAEAAGGTIVKAGGATFWGGYAGYFQDPDGHLWEVVWNPRLVPTD